MSDQMIGPTLPPNWKTKQSNEKSSKEKGHQVYGPTLPREVKLSESNGLNASTSRVIGPTLPTNFKRKDIKINESDSDSDDIIGPIPQTHHKYDKLDNKFKNCSQILAEKESQKEFKREREEWMIEMGKPLASKLTTKSVKHFSQRPVKSNDKNWGKKYKKDPKRDEELNELMDSYNKIQKRDISLIDIHNKNTKKSKSEPKVEERVAFDPEKDLSVRRLDSRQTKSVLNKAKTFNDRFSLGINKFL